MTSSLDIRDALDAINAFSRPEARPSQYRSNFRLRLNNDPVPVVGVVSTVDTFNQATVHRTLKMVHELQHLTDFSVRWQNDNVAVMCNIVRVEMLGERLMGVARNLMVQLGRTVILAHDADLSVTFEPGYIVIPQEIQELCNRALKPPTV